MKHFILFIVGLIAAFIFIANLGPLILLAVSIVFLYVIFKQFIKSTSLIAKGIWVMIGLVVLSISLSNIYALITLVAAFVLYWIYQNWGDKKVTTSNMIEDKADPFTHFEVEWEDLTNKKY